MAMPSSTIVMLLPFFMLPTILGLMSHSDSSLPFMEHCAVKDTATYCTLEAHNKDIKLRAEYSKVLERRSEEGVVESSEKRTTLCGRMVYDAESGECMKPEIAETTEERMRLDVSDAGGGFPAEILIPVFIFLVLLYFGNSFFMVAIPLVILLALFAFLTS